MNVIRCVLTTVGTSLLTNLADAPQLLALRDSANTPDADISPTLRSALLGLAENVRQSLTSGLPAAKIREAGAELNGLYGLYDDNLHPGRRDAHFLLGTDTFQGRLASELIADHLRNNGINHVEVVVPSGLSTRSQSAFSSGIRSVIHWCEKTLPGYRDSGYKITFNLTGSFKSLQAYMNTIGMFYANEIVYIFEGPSANLIRIPRLPIRIDLDILAGERELFALLADGFLVSRDRVRDWPEALWEEDGRGSATLSNWGILVWNQKKSELLAEKLLKLPCLEFTTSFERDFANHRNAQERIKLQETLATVSRLLQEHHGDTAVLKRDPGLQYDNYTAKHSNIGHFRVSLGLRVSSILSSRQLSLLHFGREEEVNARYT